LEVPCDEVFREQRLRYGLRFACEHCAHFDEVAGECLHGFPVQPHRLGPYASDHPPPAILFCKDFDLA
jgi:hypothetical protein